MPQALPLPLILFLCTYVVDGDTIHVRPPTGYTYAVRLYGVDAPEKGRPGPEGRG